MKTIRIISLILSLCAIAVAMPAAAQETGTLPKGAKWKTIKYKKGSFHECVYSIVGYVRKKQFVENQTITIRYGVGKNLEDTIASGRYYVKDGTAYLEGTFNTYLRYKWSRDWSIYGKYSRAHDGGYINKHYPIYMEGIFRISNAEEGNGLEAKSKGELRLTPVEVTAYSLRGYNMTIHKKQGNTIIYPFLRGYRNIMSIELHERDSTPETSIVNFESGDRFEGVIDYEIKDSVKFVVGDEGLIKSGTYYYTNGDKFEGTAVEYKVYNYDDRIKVVPELGTYYYANGDKFEGTFSRNKPDSGPYYYANGDKFEGTFSRNKPDSGIYYYANGDKFIGNLTTKFSSTVRKEKPIPIFTNGKTIFVDGEEVEGNWLYKYESEIGDLGAAADSLEYHLNHSKTLIELRDGVRRAYALKKREEAILAEQKQREEAKKRKEKAELAEQKRKEKAELKKRLVAKYGSRYGTLLANGEIAVGMTEEMVCEVVIKGLYKISRTVRNGRTITLWYYDDREYSAFVAFTGYFDKRLLLAPSFPSAMTFVNDRLTDIKYNY